MAKPTRTVRAEADDTKQGMTLDELAHFVQVALVEVGGSATVKQTATWRGTIKRLEVTG